jgi:hypothetical protein
MPIQPLKICSCAFLQPDFMKRWGLLSFLSFEDCILAAFLVFNYCPVPEICACFVAIKMGRRQGARRARIPKRYVTDEQRSRRPIFIATLRAAAGWLFFGVARSLRIKSRYTRRSRLEKQPTDRRRNIHVFRGQDTRGRGRKSHYFNNCNRSGEGTSRSAAYGFCVLWPEWSIGREHDRGHDVLCRRGCPTVEESGRFFELPDHLANEWLR